MLSAISNNVHTCFSSAVLRPLPILCKTLILLLLGEQNTMLCNFFMLTPVLNVPKLATMIALLSFSTICLISSLALPSTSPLTKNIFLSSSREY